MVRSQWLRVHGMRLITPLSGSLSLRLRLSKGLASPHTMTRRFILQKTRRTRPRARHLAGPWFQVLFHSPSRGSFRLSLTVLFAIGGAGYSALDRGRPGFARGSSCPALLRYRTTERPCIPHTGLSPSPAGLSSPFCYASSLLKPCGSSPCGPTTPVKLVWAPPRSLAATWGISVDFFSRVT